MSKIIEVVTTESKGSFMIIGFGLLGFELRITIEKGFLVIGGRFPRIL